MLMKGGNGGDLLVSVEPRGAQILDVSPCHQLFCFASASRTQDHRCYLTLASHYEHGLLGLPASFGQAVKYYQKAASQGQATAMSHLADMLMRGKCINAQAVAKEERKRPDMAKALLEAAQRRGVGILTHLANMALHALRCTAMPSTYQPTWSKAGPVRDAQGLGGSLPGLYRMQVGDAIAWPLQGA